MLCAVKNKNMTNVLTSNVAIKELFPNANKNITIPPFFIYYVKIYLSFLG